VFQASFKLEPRDSALPGSSDQLLLPKAVDDYVGADNPVRFIDALVGHLPAEMQQALQHLRRGSFKTGPERDGKIEPPP
jgi:hypothetical protein